MNRLKAIVSHDLAFFNYKQKIKKIFFPDLACFKEEAIFSSDLAFLIIYGKNATFSSDSDIFNRNREMVTFSKDLVLFNYI